MSEYPPPAGPGGRVTLPDGRTFVVDARARDAVLGDERVPAGVGPTAVAALDDRVYVADTTQGAILVFEVEPKLELQRRVYLPGEPYRIVARDAHLFVTLRSTGEVVELSGDGAARVLGREQP